MQTQKKSQTHIARLLNDLKQYTMEEVPSLVDAEIRLEAASRISRTHELKAEVLRTLVTSVRRVSLGILVLLGLDLGLRALVRSYPSPAWVPVLLSGGALTGALALLTAGPLAKWLFEDDPKIDHDDRAQVDREDATGKGTP